MSCGHYDDKQQDRDALKNNARAHQFITVLAIELAAAHHRKDADKEDGQDGQHRDDQSDKRK